MNYDWIKDSKYKQEYIEFIESRRFRDVSELSIQHLHHIKPRHYYRDTLKEIDNSADNTVILSPSEHAYAHYILSQATNNYKDHCAVWRTLRGLKFQSLEDLSFLDKYKYPSMPQWIKDKLTGRKRTSAQKIRISQGMIGNENAKNHKCSEEAKTLMRNLKINKTPWNKGKNLGVRKKLRCFYNTQTKILETNVTVTEMVKKYNLGSSSMSMLANNHKKSFRNWICLDNLQPSQREEYLNSLEGSETRE